MRFDFFNYFFRNLIVRVYEFFSEICTYSFIFLAFSFYVYELLRQVSLKFIKRFNFLIGFTFSLAAREISNYLKQLPNDFVTITRLLAGG